MIQDKITEFVDKNSRIIRVNDVEDYDVLSLDRWNYTHDCHYQIDVGAYKTMKSVMTIRSLVPVNDEFIKEFMITSTDETIEALVNVTTNEDNEGELLSCVKDHFKTKGYDHCHIDVGATEVLSVKCRKLNDGYYLVQVQVEYCATIFYGNQKGKYREHNN